VSGPATADAANRSTGNGHDTVTIELGARSYDVLVGTGLLAEAGGHLLPVLRQPRIVVVTDETVAEFHLAALLTALAAAGIQAESVVLPPGERTKSFAQLERLIDRLLELGVERTTTIAALGGGVVGDIAGFAASTILRGIDFVQLPTTLLAQVDSSVGGKTGINTARGKNLVGSFYQPRLVLADAGVLETLPRRQLLAGYAEVVKYGLIDDPGFFSWLEKNGTAVLAQAESGGDSKAAWRHAVTTCCRAKAAIVAQDEREAGRRALLNLGHTFAHALEAETGYGDELLHGEAVAIGICIAFDLSARLGLCPNADVARVRAHFHAVGLPTGLASLGRSFDTASLIAHMRRDKKVRDGKLSLVLSQGIGKALLSANTPEGAVSDALDRAVAESAEPEPNS